jgi:hypothetical protein
MSAISTQSVDVLRELEYPVLFRAADTSANTGQSRLLLATALRLVALISVAVLGTFSVTVDELDLTAVAAAAGLGLALVIEVYLLTDRPDRQWYESRAAAESAKTLAWRYAVAGQPFGLNQTDQRGAEALLLRRLAAITGGLRSIAPADGSALQVTEEMRRLRARTLEDRKRAYRSGRIEDQSRWYARRAAQHGRNAARWTIFLASLEALGLVAAVLNAVEVIDFDLPGIAGALAAGGLAWLQTRQHQQQASAYAIAAQELGDIASRIEWPASEAEWAHFVDEVEEAISREHTLWRASHV